IPIPMDLKATNSKFSSTITKYQSEVIELSDTDDELITVANNSSSSGAVTSDNRGIQRQLSILSCGSNKMDNS
ncbi:38500_t:CDS:2, partial [Gigaspora margarita]